MLMLFNLGLTTLCRQCMPY